MEASSIARQVRAVAQGTQVLAPQVLACSRRLDALFLLNALSIGGSERKIVRLVNGLRLRGLHAGIAYLNGPEVLSETLDTAVPRWHLERRGRISLNALRNLIGLLRTYSPPVAFSVNLYPALYIAAAASLMGERAPRTCALVNTSQFASADRARKHFYKRVLSRFDAVIYGCEAQRRAWLHPAERAWGRSSVLYNGVDLLEFDACTALPRALPAHWGEHGRRPFIVGSIGRLSLEKNQALLIEAVAALRADGVDGRLLLVGDGPLREALGARTRALGIEHAVEMTGSLTDVRPVLAMMDVFVLPSLHVETFSNAALEAMAMCKPVILSDIGGAREMVCHGIDGYVIPRGELASQLPRLLAQLATDSALRARLGQAGRQVVASRYSFAAMVDRYEQLIRRFGDGHQH